MHQSVVDVVCGCAWREGACGTKYLPASGVEGRPLKSHEAESAAVRESEILRRLFGGRLASLCVVAGSPCCSRFRDGFFHGMRGEFVFPVFVSFPVFVACVAGRFFLFFISQGLFVKLRSLSRCLSFFCSVVSPVGASTPLIFSLFSAPSRFFLQVVSLPPFLLCAKCCAPAFGLPTYH